jgi:predicted ATPase
MFDKPSFEALNIAFTSILKTVRAVHTNLHEIASEKGASTNQKTVFIALELIDGKRVPQWDISSGMFKSLMLLIELMYSCDNTVLLIDELENSLGDNSFAQMTQAIKSASFQRIISTHSATVMNDIADEAIKVVSRKGGEIHVQ